MIDDDSNELIPSDGGGDNDENAEDGNADDVQSVSIIQDEQGITFLGDAGVIDLWLKSEGFDSKAFKAKAVQTVSMASKGAQKASDAMVESGRWVKLTKESAELVAKYGKNGKKGALQAGVVRQPNGRIIKHLKFTQPGQLNPAMLTGISGVMVQMALEQAVSEITDYLKDIDAKLDDLLRDQKDQTVSKLAGISHMIDETMLIYQQVGSISETTWSKVSSCPQDIATIQAYAIAKIKGLTEKVEREQDPKQIRPLTQQIRQEIHQWLGMLASAVKMQDQVSCIELARVCQGDPEQLEAHKKGIVLCQEQAPRGNRAVAQCIGRAAGGKGEHRGRAGIAEPIQLTSCHRQHREHHRRSQCIRQYIAAQAYPSASRGRTYLDPSRRQGRRRYRQSPAERREPSRARRPRHRQRDSERRARHRRRRCQGNA